VKSGPTLAEPISVLLNRFAEGFDTQFSKFLEITKDTPASLIEAMRYSALAPGKRLRPYLVTECCRLVGGTSEASLPAATAIECVHAFSLIHDDLPAMDNANLRRGRPTSHMKFGEALAILAGDALLALAFELLTARVVGNARPTADRLVALVAELAQATGRQGMIGGQAADVEGETQPPAQDRVEYIHRCKTARLLQAACRMGVICGGGGAEPLAAL
jgi:geranylgeranyl diphosphate synthase type II